MIKITAIETLGDRSRPLQFASHSREVGLDRCDGWFELTFGGNTIFLNRYFECILVKSFLTFDERLLDILESLGLLLQKELAMSAYLPTTHH